MFLGDLDKKEFAIMMIENKYFKEYRKKLGFSKQSDIKDFFKANDIIPTVDFAYIKLLNKRLYSILDKINDIVAADVRIDDLESFKKDYVNNTFETMKENNILKVLNNQGRRPEQVYYSWMRGFVLSKYFLKAISLIFEVDIVKIKFIGDDDFRDIATFKRTPKADIEIILGNKEKLIVEIQSGFSGINDIKQHKVLEAKKVFSSSGCHTIVLHFDMYNGQVAFVKIDDILDDDMKWITRQQMEGQTVFNIDQNYFMWKITEAPIKYKDIVFD
jgi:hypothetical protein